MTATINNNTVSMNVQDTLPILLRLLDDEEINTYDDMTPTTLDYLANYADSVDAMPFTIDVIAGVPYAGVYVQGAAVAEPGVIGGQAQLAHGTRPTSYTSYPGNVLGFDMNREDQGVMGRRSPDATIFAHR